MNNEIISWNSSDYNTEEERIIAMQIFKNKLDDFFKEATYSYDEYKEERREMLKSLETAFMTDDLLSGFYMVRTHLSEDSSDKSVVLFEHPFKRFSEAIEYINMIQREHYCSYDEGTYELMWWEITRYEEYDNDYVRFCSVLLDGFLDIIHFSKNYDYEEKYTSEQKQAIAWYEKLQFGRSKYEKAVLYPFAVGDIIRMDNRPIEDGFSYMVYTGYKNEMIEEDKYDNIIDIHYFSFFKDSSKFYRILHKPEDFEVVEDCPNVLIMKMSEFLKNNPEAYCDLKSEGCSDYWEFDKKVNSWAKKILTDQEKLLLSKIDNDMTLERYIDNVNMIKENFMKEFSAELQLDEVYYIQAINSQGEFCTDRRLFHSYIELKNHMNHENQKILVQQPDMQWFWNVERQKKIDNKYTPIMDCKIDTADKVVDFNLGDCFTDVTENYMLYQAMRFVNLKSDSFAEYTPSDLFSNATAEGDGANIELPFEIGDIIRIDKAPVKEPFFVVYLGKRRSYETTIHYCLRRREWGDYKLTADHLSHPFTFEKDGNSYFPFMKKVDTSDDEALNKASLVLKQCPELVLKIDRTGVSCSDDDKLDKMLTEQYNILCTDDEYIKPTH